MKSEKTKTHLGERKMMNCGEEVEIVNYYNYTDIDVRFPDGYIKRHAQYTNFKRGGISRPTSERLMETRVMKDGNKAKEFIRNWKCGKKEYTSKIEYVHFY